MRLVNSAIDEIGSYSELNDLKQWALSLKSEIKGDMEMLLPINAMKVF